METATRADPESVVGDECHIVSGKAFGPRYDASFPIEELDEPENRGQRRQYGNGLFGRWPDNAYLWVASFHWHAARAGADRVSLIPERVIAEPASSARLADLSAAVRPTFGYLSLQLFIWLCPPRKHAGILGGGLTS